VTLVYVNITLWYAVGMEDLEAAWIAGFIDGDGCIGIQRTNGGYTLRLDATNCEPAPLEYIAARLGGTVRLEKRTNEPKNWRPRYRWCLYGQNALAGIVAIAPFLVCKQRQAFVAMEFGTRWAGDFRKRTADDHDAQGVMALRMMQLNMKGARP